MIAEFFVRTIKKPTIQHGQLVKGQKKREEIMGKARANTAKFLTFLSGRIII
jgi:hypothetical protein